MGIMTAAGKIDRGAIREELFRVIEWPSESSDRSYVTTASTVIFATIIAEMVRSEFIAMMIKRTEE